MMQMTPPATIRRRAVAVVVSPLVFGATGHLRANILGYSYPSSRLGPHLLPQSVRPKPILERLHAEIMHLTIVLDGVALQGLGGVWMDVGHDVRRYFFQGAAPSPSLRRLGYRNFRL